ncbi:MAG TPA: M23 family metallopeptidase [Burkholderiales bacterium]|nr:M23 family metallopeptidase [Burkholderiales bacterium]
MEKKTAILAEKASRLTPSALRRGRLARQWLALTGLLLLGVVAAFGIAPDTVTETVVLHRVVQDVPLSLPEQPAPQAAAQYWREERIQRGDTIGSLLARLQVTDPEAIAYLRGVRHVRTLYQLVPGRTVRAVTTREGELVTLRYLNSDGVELVVQKRGRDFFALEQALSPERRLLMSSGEIQTSLFAATDAAGLSDAIAAQLVDVFSSEVDFHRDLRPGDRFAVVFEAFYSNGEFVRSGRIVAAEFTNAGHTYRAVYYQDPQGRGGYYTPAGKNMRKTFLRSPLEFSRISSGFSLLRYHPILNTWRAHQGVDYAAPTGTRVKATADGYVQFMGRQGGYGNLILLQHKNGYSTAYGHLSGYAKGLREGQRVTQGDVIGYVGMTGLATGPHLHYELRVNGVYQNPLRLALPPGPPITADLQPAFQDALRPLLEQLDLTRGTNLAAIN